MFEHLQDKRSGCMKCFSTEITDFPNHSLMQKMRYKVEHSQIDDFSPCIKHAIHHHNHHNTHKHMTEAYATMTHFCWFAFPLFSWETLIKPEGKCLRESASLWAKKKEKTKHLFKEADQTAVKLHPYSLFNYNAWHNVQWSIQSLTKTIRDNNSVLNMRTRPTRSRLQYPKRLLPSSPVSMKEKVSLQWIKDSHH